MNIHGCKTANHIPFLVIETKAKDDLLFKGYKAAYKS